MTAEEMAGPRKNTVHLPNTTEARRAQPEVEQLRAQVRLLNEVARAVADAEDLTIIFQLAVQRLEDMFADSASIWLRKRDRLVLEAIGDRSDGVWTEPPLSAEMPEAQWLLQDEPICVGDPDLCDVPVLRHMARDLSLRSFAVAPLVLKGRAFGILLNGRRCSDGFGRQEIHFLKGVSQHVALAVQQAHLDQELRATGDDPRETRQTMTHGGPGCELAEAASEIAHEIINAISSIPLYTAVIEGEAELDDVATRHLRVIETTVDDVRTTVDRMRQIYGCRQHGAHPEKGSGNRRCA